MSVILRLRAVQAYAGLLRAQRALFGNDAASREKALVHTRLKFRENEKVTETSKIEELVSQAEQALRYIEENVVQGVRNTKGTYQINITDKTHKTKEQTPSMHF